MNKSAKNSEKDRISKLEAELEELKSELLTMKKAIPNYPPKSKETEKIEPLREYLVYKANYLGDTGEDGIINREWYQLNRTYLQKEYDKGRRNFWGVILAPTGLPHKDRNHPVLHGDYVKKKYGWHNYHESKNASSHALETDQVQRVWDKVKKDMKKNMKSLTKKK